VSKEGVMKLGDLNVSKVNKRGLAYTQTGTPYYASPEVWKDQPYNSSSDIWSLGCVIYEMVALVPPFTATDMQGLYKKIIRGIYPNIPSQYSSDLSNVIRTLLQVNPTLRPSCDKILEMPPVQRHINIPVMPNPQAADLLGTIKFEPGIKNLKQKLPGPNYDSRNRGLSAHSNRPVDEPVQQARIGSARGRDPQGQIDGSKPIPKSPQNIVNYGVPKPDPYGYKPQIKDPPKYQPRSDVYEPPSKALAGPTDLYKIPEASPYVAPYKPDRYNQAYQPKPTPVQPSPVVKAPIQSDLYNQKPLGRDVYNSKPVSRENAYNAKPASRENLYQAKPASRENANYLNSPNRPAAQYSAGKPTGVVQNPPYQQYMNKPPSRDNKPTAAYMSPGAYNPPIPASRIANPPYVAPREISSRENKPAPYAPTQDNRIIPSYTPQRDAPPSRDKVPNPYIAPRDAPPSRDKINNAYAQPTPPSRDKYSPYVAPRDAPPSRDKQAPAPYIPSRNAPSSREGRLPSREAEANKNFNKIGALVLQSPKQLVPKAMPSPQSNQAVRAQYLQQERKQQRINPVWWG
jgi:hypothetical protein